MKYVIAFLVILFSTGSAFTQSQSSAQAPSRGVIVAMAQHFVQEKFMSGNLGHYHIEFDVSYLHPQPETNYWAVVGGFVSDQNTPNQYVAALRLVCSEATKVACWQLEKLALNGNIIFDLGRPL